MNKRNFSSGYFPSSSPLAVEGGIKARSTRGAIGTSWWSGRFIEVLQSFGLGSRLQRGRAYARKGQVISLDVNTAMVTASVQGSRPRPYAVRIGLQAFSQAQWQQIEMALADDAWYVASLLDGNMPEDIERVFETVGLSLFPQGKRDLTMDCNCPDWEVPCKHLAAAFYLLAERFDEDPFRILAWRGRTREQLLGPLEAQRGDDEPEHTDTPLEELLDSFYQSPQQITPRPERLSHSLLIDQLPQVPLKIRSKELNSVLRPMYQQLRDSSDSAAD